MPARFTAKSEGEEVDAMTAMTAMTENLPLPQLRRVQMGGLPIITDEGLFQSCGVRLAFTGRAGGQSAGAYASLNTGGNTDDDLRAVAANRRTVLNAIGAHALPLIVPKQVHGTRIVHVAQPYDVGRASFEAAEGADAVQVDVPDVPAMLNFADCLPLVIVAPSGRFSVVHAGWRGALAHIAAKAVRALAQGTQGLQERDGATAAGDGAGDSATPFAQAPAEAPAAFNAYIGPHIAAECFEVGEDVAARFVAEFGEEVAPDARHVSLSRAVREDLQRAGLDPSRIGDCGVCTVCHADEYFSYRASGGMCGRQAAVAFRRAPGQMGAC